MNHDELRDYVNTQEVWAKRTRDALNLKAKAMQYLIDTGASKKLRDDTEAHHVAVVAKRSAPFDKDDNPDGEPTRQDVIDRRLETESAPEV